MHENLDLSWISIKDVMRMTGLSRSTLYNMQKEGNGSFDPTFPKRKKLSRNRVAFRKGEVSQWMATREDAD